PNRPKDLIALAPVCSTYRSWMVRASTAALFPTKPLKAGWKRPVATCASGTASGSLDLAGASGASSRGGWPASCPAARSERNSEFASRPAGSRRPGTVLALWEASPLGSPLPSPVPSSATDRSIVGNTCDSCRTSGCEGDGIFLGQLSAVSCTHQPPRL